MERPKKGSATITARKEQKAYFEQLAEMLLYQSGTLQDGVADLRAVRDVLVFGLRALVP